MIKAHRLIKHGLDGSMCVDHEETYPTMKKANTTLREKLFKIASIIVY